MSFSQEQNRNESITKKRHLEQEDFHLFHTGNLDEEHLFAFMEHIAECSFCAGKLASYEEEQNDFLSVPAAFKRDILTEANRISRTKNSAKNAFRRYCLQMAFSTGAALVLVFGSKNISVSSLQKVSLPKPTFSAAEFLNKQVNQLTDSLSISWEELKHDKKEK